MSEGHPQNRSRFAARAASDSLPRAAHYAFLADLFAGKRVLEVGCGGGEGAHYLASHGAAHVIGIDPDSGELAGGQERFRLINLELRCERPEALGLEDGCVDCIFTSGVEVLRRAAVLDELRRVLHPEGALVLAVPSADRPGARGGVTYRELMWRLRARFAPVRVVARIPFDAVSFVELGDSGEQLELEVDVTLTGGLGDPTGYIAVCGPAAAALDGRGASLVHLPAASAGRSGPAAVGAEPTAPAGSSPELIELREQLFRAEAELARVTGETAAELERAFSELDELHARLEHSEELRRELEHHVEEAEITQARLEDRLAELGASTDGDDAQGGDHARVRGADGIDARLRFLEGELEGARVLLADLETSLAALASDPPTGFVTSDRARQMATEAGIKDAELALLNLGLSSLQGRLDAVIARVSEARASMDGRTAPEMLAIMERLTADVVALTGGK